MKICRGDRVWLHYTITLAADGRVVDSSRDAEPLSIVIGDGEILPRVDEALLGQRGGDKVRVEVSASEQAFGAYDADRVQELERAEFAPDLDVTVGNVVGFDLPDGTEVAGRIVRVDASSVTVDFNHPLLGHDVTYDIEVMGVERGS